MVASLKREAIDGKEAPGVELAAHCASTLENSPGLDTVKIHSLFALS